MADLLSLTDLKAALEISDTSRDAMLSGVASAATDMIVDWLDRDPRKTDYVERAHGLGGRLLLVNQFPIVSVASISFSGQPPISADQIDFDDVSIWLKTGSYFPRGRRNVTVTYTAGLDPLPSSIKQAAIYTARAVLTSSKVDLNSSGESWAGVTSQQWNPGGPGVVPIAAQTLLKQHQRKLAL